MSAFLALCELRHRDKAGILKCHPIANVNMFLIFEVENLVEFILN